MNIDSQNKRIRRHLESGKSITAISALYQFGCFRLSARIFNLRSQGLKIETKSVTVKSPAVYNGEKHFASYSLKK